MPGFVEGLVVVLALGGMLLYFPLNRLPASRGWFFHDTLLDRHIPIVPYFVVPYLALFPYMLASAILLWPSAYGVAFFSALALAIWSAAIVWYLFPAGIMRATRLGPGFFSRMIEWVYTHDTESNTIPSSHVFYSLICSWYLILAYPLYAPLFIGCGILISISTVLVKQHHVADIAGGVVWSIGAIWLAQTLTTG